jgi:transcription antitermination protein NusB
VSDSDKVTNQQSLDKKQSNAVKTKPKLSLVKRRKARRLILQALYQWLIAKADPLDILKEFREENGGKIDWEYFQEVFIEIPKQVDILDAHLQPLLDRDASALDPIEQALLYLGTFELASRIDVPYKVVINECIDIAKEFGATDSHKYINGVLDKLALTLRALEHSKNR